MSVIGRVLVTQKVAVPVLAACVMLGAAPQRASAATCSPSAAQPPNVGTGNNVLSGVAVTSSCNAWAVGAYLTPEYRDHTLIEHWDGAAWSVQPGPNPGNGGVLQAVAATSSSNAWAVGFYGGGSTVRTLIEHWDGTAWKVVASPNSFGSTQANYLYGVTAVTPSDAWAV